MPALPKIHEHITYTTDAINLADQSCALLRKISFKKQSNDPRRKKISGVTFIKCLFSNEEINGYFFEGCTFEECQFVATKFLNCEFHRCKFVDGCFYKATISETYIDPTSFKFNKQWRQYWPNVNTTWFQALYRNAKDTHQEGFAMSADRKLHFYERYQFLNGRNKNYAKFLKGLIYDWLLGYGYGIINSLIVTCLLLLIFVALMTGHTNLGNEPDLIQMLYFSIVSFTTVGYGEITPAHQSLAMIITMIFLFIFVAWGTIVTAVIVKRLVK